MNDQITIEFHYGDKSEPEPTKVDTKKKKESITSILLWSLVGCGVLFMIYELYMSLEPLMQTSINIQ